MKEQIKKQVLDWLALLILFGFAAAIIIPAVAVPNFFMGVAAPILIVMTVIYAVLWAGLRTWKFMNEKEEVKQDEKTNDDNRIGGIVGGFGGSN